MTDEVPELEVGQFALRSFQWVEREPLVDDCAPMWTDGKVRHWKSPSYTYWNDWMDGTCTARCTRTGAKQVLGAGMVKHAKAHEIPADNCQCGIYGSLSYADLLGSFREHAKELVAVIAAEGATIIGSRGLRTAYARVVGYWLEPRRGLSRIVVDKRVGTADVVLMPDYVKPEVTAKQFPDAKRFDSPYDMVEHFGLRLLPPVEAPTKNCHGPEWWTK